MEEQKRACKVCGKVHKHCPFTDCYSGDEASLPDDIQTAYKREFENEEDE